MSGSREKVRNRHRLLEVINEVGYHTREMADIDSRVEVANALKAARREVAGEQGPLFDRHVSNLCLIRNMGVEKATELLVALGLFLGDNFGDDPDDYSDLVNYVEKKAREREQITQTIGPHMSAMVK